MAEKKYGFYSSADLDDWERLPLNVQVLTSPGMGAWLMRRDENINKQNQVRDVLALNDLILEAVVHGADMGGAYCQNEVGLKKAMQYFINRLCLENYEITEVEIIRHDGRWKVPQFKEKREVRA